MSMTTFPVGIATGRAFLGRKNESTVLETNIEKGRHTLIISPRRYGKSSLVKHVLSNIDIPSDEIDLFLAPDDSAIERKILKGIKSLINTVSETPDQWFKDLLNYFRKADKKWTVGIKGFGVEIAPEHHHDIPDNILEAFNAAELILSKKKQRAVLFIDEFQEIGYNETGKAIEGAIRHFAQESKYLVLIFSGSDRHMLAHMFQDKSRPLYELCDIINLRRMSPEVYRPYLNKEAKKAWGVVLDKAAFDTIMTITECHPRRVYVLCGRLWDRFEKRKKPPTANDVMTVWDDFVVSKSKDTRNELSRLSAGQIKTLMLLATGELEELTGKAAQSKLKMSGSAIMQALHALSQKGYIEKSDEGDYQIIDPLIKNTLIKFNGG